MILRKKQIGYPLFITSCFLLVSCSEEKPFPELHPLTGTVIQDGKAIQTGGGLIFLLEPSDGSGLIVNANVKPDGTFNAESSKTSAKGTIIQPGAPVGKYKAIFHPPSDGAKMGLEYTFSEPITVEAKNNQITLTLPKELPQGSGLPRDDANVPSSAKE